MGFVGLMRRSLSGQRNIRMHVCCLSRSSKNTSASFFNCSFFFFSPNENVKLCRWHIFRCLCKVYNSILPQTVLQVLPQSSHHSSHVSYHVTLHIFLACWSQDDRLSNPYYVCWSQVQMRYKSSTQFSNTVGTKGMFTLRQWNGQKCNSNSYIKTRIYPGLPWGHSYTWWLYERSWLCCHQSRMVQVQIYHGNFIHITVVLFGTFYLQIAFVVLMT